MKLYFVEKGSGMFTELPRWGKLYRVTKLIAAVEEYRHEDLGHELSSSERGALGGAKPLGEKV